jgi:hypothetical protein
MNINSVKNNLGHTAYELAKMLIDSKYKNYNDSVIMYHKIKIDDLLFREHQIKFELLNKDINKLKSYDLI